MYMFRNIFLRLARRIKLLVPTAAIYIEIELTVLYVRRLHEITQTTLNETKKKNYLYDAMRHKPFDK